jgi:soluble methane monooxygenase-binding protein MmoD
LGNGRHSASSQDCGPRAEARPPVDALRFAQPKFREPSGKIARSINPIQGAVMTEIEQEFVESDETTLLRREFVPAADWHLLVRSGEYLGFAKDLDFMWTWVIVRDDQIVQEGCSISLESCFRSVNHVLAFYDMAQSHGTDPQELRALLGLRH